MKSRDTIREDGQTAMSNKNFAQVFNAFTEPRNEAEQRFKLTTRELYVYANLSIRKTRIEEIPTVQTSVDLLAQFATLLRKEADNKAAVRTTLDALKSKGVVDFDPSSTNRGLITVAFPDNNLLEGHFEKIYGDVFALADNAEQFMVLCVVKRWQQSKSGVCTTGIPRWMDILERSRGTVCTLLESMKEAGKIVVRSGKGERAFNQYWVGNGVPLTKKDGNDASHLVELADSKTDATEAPLSVENSTDSPRRLDAK